MQLVMRFLSNTNEETVWMLAFGTIMVIGGGCATLYQKTKSLKDYFKNNGRH